MANEFFTILTAVGRAKLANATATGAPLTITHMAVGDGLAGAYYSPTEAQTTLKNEVWRGAINHLAIDATNPNWIVAELVIPDDVGGFYVREVGLFDSAGAMVAVGKFPESYKPTLAAGSNKQLYVRMILEVSNTAAVTLLVDPSVVLSTRKYADEKIADELNKRDAKQSVRAATTAAIALAGLQVIDGVALAAGDRVLVKDQAAGEQNGIYVAAAGNWTRATDADSGSKLNAGALVPVETGAVNADTIWMLKTDGAIIVGQTTVVFQWAGGLNAPTHAYADKTKKIATTEFVAKAGVRFSDFGSIPGGNYDLQISDIAKIIAVQANAQVVKLPPVTDDHIGAVQRLYVFPGTSKYIEVQAQEGQQISAGETLANSLQVVAGGFTDFIWEGTSTNHWEGGGGGVLNKSPDFAATHGTNGQQMLPGGLLIKWGFYNLGILAANTSYSGNVVFPDAYSTACYAALLVPADKLMRVGTNGVGVGAITGNFLNDYSSPQNITGFYIAIGK